MNRPNKLLALLCALLLALSILSGCGQEESPFSPLIPEAPAFSTVYDGIRLFSTRQTADFDAKNAALFALTGAEIAVVSVESTGDLSTGEFARQVFNKWGIGSNERMNGILILLVPAENDYYLQTGSGMQVILPPETLRTLALTHLEPDFAAGRYAEGTVALFEALLSHLETTYSVETDTWPGTPGTFTPAGTADLPESKGVSALTVFLILLAVAVFLLLLFLLWLYLTGGRRHRRRPYRARGARGRKVSVRHIQNGPRGL